LLIDQLEGQANDCMQKWQVVAAWPAKNAAYQTQLTNAAKSHGKIKVPASANPGPQPAAPDAANCAPASAFAITVPASPAVTPSAHPTTTTSAKPSTSPTARASASASATQAAG
jgi:hypothetical protein